MLSNIRKVSKGPLGLSLRLPVLALCLVLAVAASSGPETVTPSPRTSATPDTESVAPEPAAPATPDMERAAPEPTPSATPDTERVAPTPAQSDMPDAESVAPEPTTPATPDTESTTPEHTPTYSIHPPAHYGAATPSVEERIYDSDVIIRASLQSSGTGSLRFRTIEYLKGAGPAEIVVLAPTSERNTAWDDREAVLFLSLPEDQAASGATGATREVAAGEFVFTEAYRFTDPIYKDRSKLPTGYTIGKRNPVWLPAQAEGGTSGAAGDGAPASDPACITDSTTSTSGSPPTISLADLRSKIAWVEGGERIEGYDQCIGFSLNYQQYIRDWEAYYGSPWNPYQSERQVASGAGEGVVIRDREYSRLGDLEYIRFRLSGQDTDLFKSEIVDDDVVAPNGYNHTITTTRPLPSITTTGLRRDA